MVEKERLFDSGGISTTKRRDPLWRAKEAGRTRTDNDDDDNDNGQQGAEVLIVVVRSLWRAKEAGRTRTDNDNDDNDNDCDGKEEGNKGASLTTEVSGGFNNQHFVLVGEREVTNDDDH